MRRLMRRLLCLMGRHHWKFLGRNRYWAGTYLRYDRCPHCKNIRLRAEVKV